MFIMLEPNGSKCVCVCAYYISVWWCNAMEYFTIGFLKFQQQSQALIKECYLQAVQSASVYEQICPAKLHFEPS